jgi:NADH-quinone oxidoreductase subunit L
VSILAVFLPLVAAFIAGFFGRLIGDRAAQLVTAGAMCLAGLCGIATFYDVAVLDHSRTVALFTWFSVGELQIDWALRLDTLSAVMVMMVSVISAAIHIYSIGYMSHDKSIPRFMSYLSFFTFFMLALVTADNFVQMFFGWEGVGLCSYLLIGFWYDRDTANAAAIKAFVVNRIGDFGFLLGIFAVFFIFGSLQFDAVFAGAADVAGNTIRFLSWQFDALTVTCILLFVGAMGKSAQIGLHTWLPDAMEGPTPVSALIHAATMVTAGVFMVARLSPLFEYAPNALAFVAIIGGTTAIFAASVGMAQNDIKRVIAYSTCSQLGYMFFAAGVSAYSAAMLHLFTHAFFKALLFLGAGSVIHAMSGEQDMRKMGGIWRKVPVTYAVMWIGSLALAGIPWFSGYFSKDTILEAAWAAETGGGHYAYWMGLFAAFLTAFYSWRLLIMTFHGAPRAGHDVMHHVHESPMVMLAPLIFLSVGAIFAGGIAHSFFVGEERGAFWGNSILVLGEHDPLENIHHIPAIIGLLPLIAAVLGIATAYYCYMFRPELPGLIAARVRPFYLFLFNKWYFDELYDRLFVRTAFWGGRFLWKQGDGAMIDGLGPDGISAQTIAMAVRAGRLQTGYLYHYAFAILIGAVIMVSWYLFQSVG